LAAAWVFAASSNDCALHVGVSLVVEKLQRDWPVVIPSTAVGTFETDAFTSDFIMRPKARVLGLRDHEPVGGQAGRQLAGHIAAENAALALASTVASSYACTAPSIAAFIVAGGIAPLLTICLARLSAGPCIDFNAATWPDSIALVAGAALSQAVAVCSPAALALGALLAVVPSRWR
jgi:hypothetical protein